MKIGTILGIAVGAVAVLVVIAAVAVYALFDAKTLKAEIEKTAQEKTGRKLSLEGDLKLAFYPSVGASIGKVKLSEKGNDREFASVESAHVSVAVMPLLRGAMVVDEVRVAGLKANVVKGKDGKFNFDDLLGGDAKSQKSAEKGAPAQGAKSAVSFDISGVRVERSAFSYKDEKSGQEIAVSDLNLRTGRIANDVPGKMALSVAVKGKNPAVDSKLSVSAGYQFNLEKKAFAFSGLDLKLAGNAAGMSGLDVAAKGDLAANPEKQEYSASKFSLDAKGAMGKDSFAAKLGAPKIAIAADKASGDAITADLALKSGENAVDAKLKLSGVQGSAKALAIAGIDADVTINGPQLPGKQVKLPIRGKANADLEKEKLNAELSTKFDESTIQAKVGLTDFTPPVIAFDVAIDKLDLDRYMPPAPAGGAAKGGDKGGGGDAPVDLSGLKALNADGKLAIGSLTANRVKLTELKAELHAKNGAVQVTPHSANLYGGSLAGALSLNANGNVIAVKENLSNVSIGPLVKDLAQRDAIEGKGNVTLDVTTAGGTVGALKKALAGNAKVVLKDGAIKGIDLAGSLRKAKSALGSKTAQTQQAEGGQKTDFSEMSASFVIRNGVAHNEDLDARAPLFRLGGAGDIDIGNSQLNYLAKASIVASAKGQGGGDLDSLAGLTVPVKLTGPFDAVKYEIDYAGLAAQAAKSKVTEAVKDKVGGKLGGLLGGGSQPAQGGAPAGGAPAKSEGTKEKLRGLFGR